MTHSLLKKSIVLLLFWGTGVAGQAQFHLQSEYITSARFRDEAGNKTGGKGDLKTVGGGVKIPVSIKTDAGGKPIAWAVVVGGTYASVGRRHLPDEFCIPELVNAQAGVMHLRPIARRWSVMAMLGAGVFSEPGKVSGKSVLGQGGVLFIMQVKPHFSWGTGVTVNNALGYPMLFPSFYLEWKLDGRYEFNLSMQSVFGVSVSRAFGEHFRLGAAAELKGLMAAVERNEKDMYFIMQYGFAGVQPEFRLGKSLSIPVTAGVAFARDTYFQSRTLKAFLKSEEDYPHFGTSAYFAAGIKYGF